jgi:hypothetical protein
VNARVSAAIEKHLRDVGDAIAEDMPKGWGFTLFMFEYGPGGTTVYLSTAKREDMLRELRDWLDREQGRS